MSLTSTHKTQQFSGLHSHTILATPILYLCTNTSHVVHKFIPYSSSPREDEAKHDVNVEEHFATIHVHVHMAINYQIISLHLQQLLTLSSRAMLSVYDTHTF